VVVSRRSRLAAMALTVAALLAAANPGVARAATVVAWRPWYLGRAGSQLTQVAATGRHDVWAVGQVGSSQYSPFVLHWNGAGWRQVTIPGSAHYQLLNVAGSSAGNVWVFGVLANGNQRAFRWDGAHWHDIPMPSGTVVFGIPVVRSAADVWVTSSDALCSRPSSQRAWQCGSTVFHWNGTTWQSTNIPAVEEGLAGSPARGVWAVADLPTGTGANAGLNGVAVAYHWTGKAWAAAGQMPHPPLTNNYDFASISAQQGSIWIGTLQNSDKPLYMLHFAGSKWLTTKIPYKSAITVGASLPDVYPAGGDRFWLTASGLWNGKSLVPVPWVRLPAAVSTWWWWNVAEIPGTTSYVTVGTAVTKTGDHAMVSVTGPNPLWGMSARQRS
jgi:hypothetical protein